MAEDGSKGTAGNPRRIPRSLQILADGTILLPMRLQAPSRPLRDSPQLSFELLKEASNRFNSFTITVRFNLFLLAFLLSVVSRGLEMAASWFELALRGGHQGPTRLQEHHSWAQNASRASQEGRIWRLGGSRKNGALLGPHFFDRPLQDGPRRTPKASKRGPGDPRNDPKRAPRGSKTAAKGSHNCPKRAPRRH